jgi:hypothetical protein
MAAGYQLINTADVISHYGSARMTTPWFSMKFCSLYFSTFNLVKRSWIQVGFSPQQSRTQSLLTVLTTPLSAISEWGCCYHHLSAILSTINKTVNIRITLHWAALVQPLFQWKSNEYYITWVCVFVALGIQHAMRMCHIVICGLPCSTVFFHIIS